MCVCVTYAEAAGGDAYAVVQFEDETLDERGRMRLPGYCDWIVFRAAILGQDSRRSRSCEKNKRNEIIIIQIQLLGIEPSSSALSLTAPVRP